MDLQDLLATHTDCADCGKIKETLLYEIEMKDYGDTDKNIEFTNFFLRYLDGAKLEMFFPDSLGATMYLSFEGEPGIECYYVRYTPEVTRIYDLRPVEGEIADDKILCRM